jgi:hypothetical protein
MHGRRKASITKKLRKGLFVSKKRNRLSFGTFLGKYNKKLPHFRAVTHI